MKKIITFLVCFSLVHSAIAADFKTASTIYEVKSVKQYMVSGILRKGTSEMTIKLVHSIYTASSEDEAIGVFTRDIGNDFPGYSILTILASQVETETKCDTIV